MKTVEIPCHAKTNAFGWSETIEEWFHRVNDENYEEIDPDIWSDED